VSYSIEMDVNDKASILLAAKEIERKEGKLDLLVNKWDLLAFNSTNVH
jgi:NAD(P)-dependent dehydrogenase (short-subunit alcohol dehydrogenase family)